MSALALPLLAVLATSVSGSDQPPPEPGVLLAGEEEPMDPRLPKPRIPHGDMPWYGGRPDAPLALDDVALAFKPTEYVGPFVSRAWKVLANKRVSVVLFGDERPAKARPVIGWAIPDRMTVTTHDDVSAWCSLQMVSFLRRASVDVVPTGGDLVVSGTVRKFFVEEWYDYEGTVILQITVTNAAGHEIWSGEAAGTSKRWGRAYKADLYLETLSDSLLRAFDAWVTDPRFASAVGK